MEIIISDSGSGEFYDEALSVIYNRKRLIKNPKKKLYGLSFNAAVLTIISLIIVAILKILTLMDGEGYYGYISMIFIFTMAYGIVYYVKVRNRISELKNRQTTSKLIIEKDFVELVSEKEEKIPLSKIMHIIINRHTISFIPKDGDGGIIISTDYKNQILDAVDCDRLIVDNTHREI